MWSIQKLQNETTYTGSNINVAFLLAGDISIQALDKSYQIPKKHFFYFEDTFKVTSTSPYYEGFILSLTQEFVDELESTFSSEHNNYQPYRLDNAPLLKSLLSSLMDEKKDNSTLISSYLNIILQKTEESKKVKKEPSLFENFIDLIDENIENNYCAGTYATMLKVPLKELITEVKNNTHKTPCNVITGQVIKKAKELLTTTKDSSKMIAYQLGFEEPYYFIKYFKRNVGVTPTQYRKQH